MKQTKAQKIEAEIAAKIIGPRQVGGRYLCGYWQQEYIVTAIEPKTDWMPVKITVRWADGHSSMHCTQWEPGKDRVISQPAVAA